MRHAAVPFKESLEAQVVQGYRICAAALGLFFLVLAPWRMSIARQRPHGTFLAWEAVGLALFFCGFALLAPRLRAWTGAVENLALLLVGAGLVNNLSLLALLRDPEQASNFMLILVASGLIFQSTRRFLLIQSLVLALWCTVGGLLVRLPDFLAWAFPVLCAALLGLGIHLFLNRLMRAVEKFRSRDQILLRQRARLVTDLRTALEGMKTLRGLIPICSQCKKVRNDEGYWQQVESYLGEHSEAEFTHGLCPGCTSHLQDEFERIVPPRWDETLHGVRRQEG